MFRTLISTFKTLAVRRVALVLGRARARARGHRALAPALRRGAGRPHERGHVKLCDFGCAAEFDKSHSDGRTFQQLIGTPEYLAPEMVTSQVERRPNPL